MARYLAQMATSLAIGRDLLHTHLAPGPGGRTYLSPWAPPVTCERVRRALLADIGSLAAPIAHHGMNVALSPVPGAPASADRRRRMMPPEPGADVATSEGLVELCSRLFHQRPDCAGPALEWGESCTDRSLRVLDAGTPLVASLAKYGGRCGTLRL